MTRRECTDLRLVGCEACDTEGRDLRSSGGPDDIDYGPCRHCDGTGAQIIPVELVSFEDLNTAEAA